MSKNIRSCLLAAAVFLVLGTAVAQAQTIEDTIRLIPLSPPPAISPNVVGSGARALGMGGAFIGVADDATAASWNPAGLIQLERPEMSMVGAVRVGRVFFESKDFPDLAGTNYINSGDLNYFSLAYPFTIKRRNFVVSLNYQHLYDLSGAVDFGKARFFPDISMLLGGPGSLYIKEKAKLRMTGKLYTISPAIAVEILPTLSLGATFNFWPPHQGMESLFIDHGTGAIFIPSFFLPIIKVPARAQLVRRDRSTATHAFNGNLGLLWNINKYITIGLVYKFPFKVPITHFRDIRLSIAPSLPVIPAFTSKETKDRLMLHLPPSYGAGLAVHFSDKLTMDLDFYCTDWREAYYKDSKEGKKSSFINVRTIGKGKGKANIDPTYQVRLGAEYLFIFEKTVVPLRAGWFYDPSPASNQPDKYYGLSIGTGISLGKLILDAAYQYRFGNQVGKDVFGAELNRTSANVNQHTLLFSAIYHF